MLTPGVQLTCGGSSRLSPGAAACVCVRPASWLHGCGGLRPERAGCIHVGRLNGYALPGAGPRLPGAGPPLPGAGPPLPGAGPPSGRFPARFEGAKGSAAAAVSPAAAAVSLQVGVRSAWLPVSSSSDAEEGALPQDGLQLLHSLPGEAHLGGRSALRSPLPGPLVLCSCSIRPGLTGSFWAPGVRRADGDDSRGLRR